MCTGRNKLSITIGLVTEMIPLLTNNNNNNGNKTNQQHTLTPKATLQLFLIKYYVFFKYIQSETFRALSRCECFQGKQCFQSNGRF